LIFGIADVLFRYTQGKVFSRKVKMFERIISHKYFFHIVAIIVILTVIILFIVFSGNSADTYVDSKAELKTAVGKEFVITLDANATTGYEWQLASPIDDNLIKLVSSEYTPDNTGLVGSGGKSIWTFKAAQAGKAQVSFKYIRPWENNTPLSQRTTYIVSIQGSAKALEAPDMIDQPPSAHWSDEDVGWGEEDQDE